MPANVPTRYSVPYDGKLNIDEFSEGMEKAMPISYRITRDSENNSMKVQAGLFLFARVTIRRDLGDEDKYVVECGRLENSMKEVLRNRRMMLIIFLTGYLSLIYFYFFVGMSSSK